MNLVADVDPGFAGAVDVAPSVLEAHCRPDAVAEWAATAEPGADMFVPLAAIPSGSLSAQGQIDAVAALTRLESWVDAQRLRLLGEISRTRRDVAGKDYVREEIGAAMRVSSDTAGARLSLARILNRHPAILAAMESGVLTEMHARVFVDETFMLADADAAAVETRVLAGAAARTVGEFRRSVRRAVLTAAPDVAEQRHQKARADRYVGRRPLADGMEETFAALPAEQSGAAWANIEAEAAKIPADDPRTRAQRLADSYTALLLGQTCPDGAPSRFALKPDVQVAVGLSTIAALDDEPGELAGYGPIPASLSRLLAADETATLRRLITDDLGRVLDFGRRTYRPPAELARHVIARDGTCRFPNCPRPARRCDIDHRVDWTLDGETKPDNLNALCERHHQLKHETTWHYEVTDDSSVVWTSPTGHIYTRLATTYPVDTTTRANAPPGEAAAPTDSDPPPF
ncbi:MAG TPA: DUF222 domain-containing protein [Jatrophihabitantaceae bacterium]|nr:DUF222 domain-containing protein [Jatrophihabitantaceae bacterium]